MATKLVTLEELAEIVIKKIREMTPDEKAHLRAKLRRAFLADPPPKIAYKM